MISKAKTFHLQGKKYYTSCKSKISTSGTGAVKRTQSELCKSFATASLQIKSSDTAPLQATVNSTGKEKQVGLNSEQVEIKKSEESKIDFAASIKDDFPS